MAKRKGRSRPAGAPRTADRTSRRTHPPSRQGKLVLLLILVPDPQVLEELVPELIDLGLHATVLQTRGLASVLREDLPMFGGIASLLPVAPAGRLLLSLASKPLADRLIKLLREQRFGDHPPIAATIPIGSAVGLRPIR